VHVQQAPRRREAVGTSGRRTARVVCGGEQGPGHGGGVERVQVVEEACRHGGQKLGRRGVKSACDWDGGLPYDVFPSLSVQYL
jgi:hypothetical protein